MRLPFTKHAMSDKKKQKGPKIDRFEKERIKKHDKIVELGHDPYGQRFDNAQVIEAVRGLCPDFIEAAEDAEEKPHQPDGPTVRTTGRVMLRRKAGKLRFYDIEDASGKVQLLFSRGNVSDEVWELMGQIDLGDIVGVDGIVRRTNTGEISIAVSGLTMLCKSLVQPPEKWHGLEDAETRLRNREQDLIYSNGVRDVLLTRSAIIASVRQTLNEQDFIEVETPVLHSVAGGAAARPFVTHHNALDLELYQRIALELHLKRLMVGGIDRVYEIGRVFRNEGIDATHNPEFTMLEVYQAYGNYESMMDLTEAIIKEAADVAHEAMSVTTEMTAKEVYDVMQWADLRDDQPELYDAFGEAEWTDKGRGRARRDGEVLEKFEILSEKQSGHDENRTVIWHRLETPPEIDAIYNRLRFKPFERAKYSDLFDQHVGCSLKDEAACAAKAKQHGIETEGRHPDVIVGELFEEFVEDNLVGPVFVIDYPASLCPLTKRKQSDPAIAERFELFIDGMELANAYTELNDPRLQEELFQTQLAGLDDEESMAKMDHEFIRALKVGMPPAGGLGIGIDRLVMLLTNSQSIRDVIYFPLLRPEGKPKKDN